MGYLTSPAFLPFTIAATVLLSLVLLEIVSMVAGASMSDYVDDVFGGDKIDAGLGWLNIGRVPLLILLMLLLASFSVTGMAMQSSASRLIGPLPIWMAAPAAAFTAIAVTRPLTRLISRILPKEETYAVNVDDLVGRVGKVTLGPLDSAAPGRAMVTDSHGNPHFPQVRPAHENEQIEVGAEVLLVERVGLVFLVIRAPDSLSGAHSE